MSTKTHVGSAVVTNHAPDADALQIYHEGLRVRITRIERGGDVFVLVSDGHHVVDREYKLGHATEELKGVQVTINVVYCGKHEQYPGDDAMEDHLYDNFRAAIGQGLLTQGMDELKVDSHEIHVEVETQQC